MCGARREEEVIGGARLACEADFLVSSNQSRKELLSCFVDRDTLACHTDGRKETFDQRLAAA